MTTITSKSGKKAVRMSNNNGQINACYVQYNKEADQINEQLLELKTFKTEKSAEKWAEKILN